MKLLLQSHLVEIFLLEKYQGAISVVVWLVSMSFSRLEFVLCGCGFESSLLQHVGWEMS